MIKLPPTPLRLASRARGASPETEGGESGGVVWSLSVSALPWFLRHPRIAVAVAAALFTVVFLIRAGTDDAVDVVGMLYTLPIALLALMYGRRGGVLAGLLAVALVGIWVLLAQVPLSPAGWATRLAPLLLVGFLLGDAADRLRAAEQERRRLHAAALLHAEAIEVNDTLVQGMSAAMWALDSGRTEEGTAALRDTLATGHRVVSRLLHEANMGGQTWTGPVAGTPPEPREVP